MTPDRRRRLLQLARARRDRLALAVLEGDRRYTPEPEGYPMLQTPWLGLRWSVGAAA